MVLRFLGVDDLKVHGEAGVGGTVISGGLCSYLHGPDLGLVHADVAQGLTLGGELELLFFLFVLVFSHLPGL